eukprot:TRINITY_DN6476_c0_g1_i2.p1 TRINITY_DN6476_c0_g1~~TRINITY_DN6476_c0_g1_i2.p1  ORF type:complete len:489 (+),score=103.85 TRINITY_DN6476_c0_g1_i2:172-1638(+)
MCIRDSTVSQCHDAASRCHDRVSQCHGEASQCHDPHREYIVPCPSDTLALTPHPHPHHRHPYPHPHDISPLREDADLSDISAVARSIRELCRREEASMCQGKDHPVSHHKFKRQLHNWAVAPVLPSASHAVQRLYAVGDEHLSEVLVWLSSWPVVNTLEVLDVPAHPHVDLTAAANVMVQFSKMADQPPFDQLEVLREVTLQIVEAIRIGYAGEARDSYMDSPDCFTGADLLVPLLIGVIVLSRPSKLVSQLALLDHLQPQGLEVTEYGFHLCNLQVSVLCLTQQNLSPQSPHSPAGLSHGLHRLAQLTEQIRQLATRLDCKAVEAYALNREAQQAFRRAADQLTPDELLSDGAPREQVRAAVCEELEELQRGRLGSEEELLAVLNRDGGGMKGGGHESVRALLKVRGRLKEVKASRDRLQREHAQAVLDRERLKSIFQTSCARLGQAHRLSRPSIHTITQAVTQAATSTQCRACTVTAHQHKLRIDS